MCSSSRETKLTLLVVASSKANVISLEEKEAELGFCQSDVMAYAYNGTNIFADAGKVDCFSVLGALYTEQVQIVTTNPDIKSVEGKRHYQRQEQTKNLFHDLNFLPVFSSPAHRGSFTSGIIARAPLFCKYYFSKFQIFFVPSLSTPVLPGYFAGFSLLPA